MGRRSKYGELGVDAHKAGVQVFRRLIDTEFPYSFAPIVKEPESGEYIVLHVDGAGSKPIVAYLYYKETGMSSYFRGLAQDVIAMNVNDIVAVGARPIAFSDYVAVNPLRLPKPEVLRELAIGFSEVLGSLSGLEEGVRGLPLFCGGETADLPDQVRTLDIVGFVYGRVSPSEVVSGGDIAPGSIVVGLRSGGRASYERSENSGIMCNGLTLARHVLLDSYYKREYPETCEPSLAGTYKGRYRVDTYVDELGMTIGEALLSPTRIYTPIAMDVLRACGEGVKGMAHITGGGLTKLLRLGSGIKYVIDGLPEPDPIFKLIQREGDVGWREMYEVFNMGVGFALVVSGLRYAEEVIGVAEKYNVEAFIIGHTERGRPGENTLIVRGHDGKVYSYRRTLGR